MAIPVNPLFLLAVAGSFVSFGVLAGLYIWPRLTALPRSEALKLLALPHAFRFVGLSFLITGVVSPLLPSAFAVPDAWGDLTASVLALLSIVALTRRWSFAVPLVWLFNLWGTLDLLNGFYQGISHHIDPGAFGAAYYLPTLIVPGLFVLHIMAFMLLVRQSVPQKQLQPHLSGHRP